MRTHARAVPAWGRAPVSLAMCGRQWSGAAVAVAALGGDGATCVLFHAGIDSSGRLAASDVVTHVCAAHRCDERASDVSVLQIAVPWDALRRRQPFVDVCAIPVRRCIALSLGVDTPRAAATIDESAVDV